MTKHEAHGISSIPTRSTHIEIISKEEIPQTTAI